MRFELRTRLALSHPARQDAEPERHLKPALAACAARSPAITCGRRNSTAAGEAPQVRDAPALHPRARILSPRHSVFLVPLRRSFAVRLLASNITPKAVSDEQSLLQSFRSSLERTGKGQAAARLLECHNRLSSGGVISSTARTNLLALLARLSKDSGAPSSLDASLATSAAVSQAPPRRRLQSQSLAVLIARQRSLLCVIRSFVCAYVRAAGFASTPACRAVSCHTQQWRRQHRGAPLHRHLPSLP